MMRRLLSAIGLVCMLVQVAGSAEPDAVPKPPPVSDETDECITCHEEVSPGIVTSWRASRHARTTPAMGLAKPEQERRISAKTVPDKLKSVAVGCYECHSLNAAAHKDNVEHFDYKINIVVSPNDCATCHPDEAKQYAGSKKAHALANLQENPVYHTLVDTVDGVKTIKDGVITGALATEATKAQTCYGCHGTVVEVKGMRTVDTDAGETKLPILTGWPNQGVGRVNPDGSRGACTVCHPRHGFSIEVARKPETCGQCHLEPDVPAYNVYKESKHGNLYASKKSTWTWDSVPWVVGRDFEAPTCATCHVSLVTTPGETVVAKRSHDFGSRLWVRLFGLPYAHPQPKTGATHVIRNADGLPLPTTFDGRPATDFLIDKAEAAKRQKVMHAVCQTCHGSSWVQGHFKRLDSAIDETNQMTLTSTQLVQKAWKLGLADPKNPFDEGIEFAWVTQWVFYANSIRYAAAMSGPDYAAFKNGWWELSRGIQRMHDWIRVREAKAEKAKAGGSEGGK